MNRSQGIVLAAAAANAVIMLLFPPYDSVSIWRSSGTSFDAFYFLLDRRYNKIINADLLFLELYWVLANAGIAWLLLRRFGEDVALMSRRNATFFLTALNLALLFLFPPFENYSSATRWGGQYFDGFYFVFGDKGARRFYVPLLYLEVLWVLINGAALWLAFRDPQDASRQDEA